MFLLLKPSEIDRSTADEAKYFSGTNSHYAYEARTVPTKLSVRRYSCYCKKCSARKFRECEHWEVWRSRKYREHLQSDGWHTHKMSFVDERDAYLLRTCSMEVRQNFMQNHTHAGETTIAVYCGDRDPCGFWLARCEAASKQSNTVVYGAKKNDDNWDIKKGEQVLNITWLNRVSETECREFKLHMPQTITLTSVLPVAAVWDQMHGNTYFLSQASHDKMCGWRDCVRDDLHKERNKLKSEITRPAIMGNEAASFDMLPSVLKQLTTTRHCAIAEATEAAAWLAAAHAARRAYIALVQCGAMEKDELPLCVLRSVD